MSLKLLEIIRDTSPYSWKVRYVFSVKHGMRNGDNIFVEGKVSCRRFMEKEPLERNLMHG